MRNRLILIAFGFFVLWGCDGDSDPFDDFTREPDAEPIRATVRTSIPMAYIASVSMAAARGDLPENTTVSNTCSSYPCTSLVYIELNDPSLPFGLADVGNVMVAGLWSSDRQAILTVTFLNAAIGTSDFSINSVSTFPAAEPVSGGVKIVYADIDVNVSNEPDDEIVLTASEIEDEYDRLDTVIPNDPEVSLGMDAWVVEMEDGGTPDWPDDDRYQIAGGGQYLSAGSSAHVLQLAMAETTVSWNCPHNPTDGLAAIHEGGTGDSLPVIASALIEFTPQCTGNARITLGTGNYITSTGSDLTLNLSMP